MMTLTLDKPESLTHWPLPFIPTASYNDTVRGFDALRPEFGPGVKHGACDLYGPTGTPVYVVEDSVIGRPQGYAPGAVPSVYEFYRGTKAVELQSAVCPRILRYCEITVLPGLGVGSRLKAGDQLGVIAPMAGLTLRMLHLECYSGTSLNGPVTGPLTVPSAQPYRRRSDILNPATVLDICKSKFQSQSGGR